MKVGRVIRQAGVWAAFAVAAPAIAEGGSTAWLHESPAPSGFLHIGALPAAEKLQARQSTPTSLIDEQLVDAQARGHEVDGMCAALPEGVDHAALHEGPPGTAPLATLQRYGMVESRLRVMQELMRTQFGNRSGTDARPDR